MKVEELKNLCDLVENIVLETGKYALDAQLTAKKMVDKEKGDYATDVDLACEKMILERLAKLPKTFPVFSEEANQNIDSDIYWVVDPIDGTKNYFRELPLWSINLALFDNTTDEVLLSVVYFPKLGDVYKAVKGNGATKNGHSITPSTTSDLSEAIIYVELPNKSRDFWGEEVYNDLKRKVYRIRSWGLAASLCYVADGGFDGFVDISGTTKDYDILPPLLIAKEAGCKIVEFDHDLDIKIRPIKVTNGVLEL